jgi:hypothetical protein
MFNSDFGTLKKIRILIFLEGSGAENNFFTSVVVVDDDDDDDDDEL